MQRINPAQIALAVMAALAQEQPGKTVNIANNYNTGPDMAPSGPVPASLRRRRRYVRKRERK